MQNNPQAFADSYWAVNSLKVYSADDSSPAPLPSFGQPIPANSSALIHGTAYSNSSGSRPTSPLPILSTPVAPTLFITQGITTATAAPTVMMQTVYSGANPYGDGYGPGPGPGTGSGAEDGNQRIDGPGGFELGLGHGDSVKHHRAHRRSGHGHIHKM